ncbi:MAG TPA: nitrate reductase molybdenum cofactor assembly chaperone [Steroidobacter sp.]|jgi:nitrate reductase delta subunit|nr:nitrate reductase molybdenum cofactor assembly chaperone [Steroidobacter sp.]
MKTFQALAALLEYPTEALANAIDEIEAVLKSERLLEPSEIDALQPLMREIAHGDLLEAQERYVETFDRGRAASLNLFEHVHGESRDRGQAMIDLKQLYGARGLELTARQLPDYLPVMLEYLALGSPEEARSMLSDCAHILQSIGSALSRRGSAYAAVLRALERYAGADAVEASANAAAEDDLTPEAVDRAWAEEPVSFLGGGCPSAASPLYTLPIAKGMRP